MKRRHFFLIAIIVIGLASVAALAGAGSASAGTSECPFSQSTANLCLWQNGNWTGTIWRYWQAKDVSNTWHYVGDNANDQASSIDNDRVHSAYIGRDWTGSGPGSGPTSCLVPNYAYPHLEQLDWNASSGGTPGDNISSFDLLYSATSCPAGTQPVVFGI
jgi:hypothetical protein